MNKHEYLHNYIKQAVWRQFWFTFPIQITFQPRDGSIFIEIADPSQLQPDP